MTKNEGLEGATFGVMDGIIIALGVMMGLSATGNNTVLFVSIMIAGIADSFANAAGMHVSEETEEGHTRREIWKSTIFAFFATLIAVIVIALPILLLPITYAIWVGFAIGVIMLGALGHFVAGVRRMTKHHIMLEYIAIGVLVSIICYALGQFVVGVL